MIEEFELKIFIRTRREQASRLRENQGFGRDGGMDEYVWNIQADMIDDVLDGLEGLMR